MAGTKAAVPQTTMEEDPLLSDEEQEGHRMFRSSGSGGRAYRRQHQRVQLPPDDRQPLDKEPSLDTWVQQGQQRRQRLMRESPPLHLRTPPPDSTYLQQPLRMASKRKDLQQQMLPENLRDRAVEPSPDAAYKFPTSGSPWSSEKVVVDLSARRPQSVSPPQLATAAVVGRDAAAAVNSQRPADAAGAAMSPLVQAGKIINPNTGKAVLINKAKYNELIDQGYHADLVNGILVPPTAAATAAAAAGRGNDAMMYSPAEAAVRGRRRSTRQDSYSPRYS